MNALFKLMLRSSAIGALALMTTAVGCSDSDKDDENTAGTSSSAGQPSNEGGSASNEAGQGTGGSTAGTSTNGGAPGEGGSTAEAGAAAGGDKGQAGAAGAGGADAGPAVAKFCNTLTFGTDQDPMDTTMVLEIGEGDSKVTFTASTKECVPVDCTEIPLGDGLPYALYDADDTTTALDSGTIDVLAGENWVFITDLTDTAEPSPIVTGGVLKETSGTCQEFVYDDI